MAVATTHPTGRPPASAPAAGKSAALVLEPTRSYDGLAPLVLDHGRWTVGSAEGCGLRLEAVGVRDNHALLVADDGRVVLKAWDRRTWLNEGPVREAVLRPGDRLVIGPVEFHVRAATPDDLLALPQSAPATAPAPPEPAAAQTPHTADISRATAAESSAEPPALPDAPTVAPEPDSDSRGEREQLQRLQSTLATEAAALRERERELSRRDEALARDRLTLKEHVQRLADRRRALAELEAELDRQQSDLDAAEADRCRRLALVTEILAEQSTWQRELLQREADQAHQRRALDAEAERLREAASRLERQSGDEVDSEPRRELPEREAEWLAAERDALAVLRAENEAERESLARREAELDALLGELESERAAVAAERATMDAEQAAFQTEREALIADRETLAAERSALATARSALAADEERAAAERESFRLEQEADGAALDRQRSELDRQRKALEVQATELESLRQDLENQRRQLEDGQARLATDRDRLAAWESELSARNQAAASAAAEHVPAPVASDQASAADPDDEAMSQPPSAPEGFRSRLAEMFGIADMTASPATPSGSAMPTQPPMTWQDDADVSEPIEAEPIDAPPRSMEDGPASPPPVDDSEDSKAEVSEPADVDDPDSVAAYMERLLARTRRPGQTPAAPPAPPPKPSRPAPPPAGKPLTEPRPAASAPTAAGVSPAAEPSNEPIKPRRAVSKDVERADIDSLRELANLSAKTAVAQHSWKKLRSGVAVKVGLIIVSLAVAGFLFATRLHSPLLAAGAGMAALLLAGELLYSLTQFWRIARRKKPRREKRPQADAGGSDAAGSVDADAE